MVEAAGPGLGSLSQMVGGKPEIAGDASELNGRAWKPDLKIVRGRYRVCNGDGTVGSMAPER